MAKSKCSVQVESSRGISYTDHRGARRLVQRGMARKVSDRLIVMLESDPRVFCDRVSVNPARLAIVARNARSCEYRNEVLGLPNFVRTGAPRAISHGKKAA